MIRVISVTVLLGLLGLVKGQAPQVAPWTLELEPTVNSLLFVAPGCTPCLELATALDGLDGLIVITQVEDAAHDGAVLDPGGLAARTFRVSTVPTLILTLGRQEVMRQVGHVDIEVFHAGLAALRDGRMRAHWTVGIEIGRPVEGPLRAVTGLVMYIDDVCAECEMYSDQIERLRADDGIDVRVVGSGAAGFGAVDADIVDTPTAWGLPAAPMHVYLLDGVPLWIDTGARDDLHDIVRLIIELQ